jgi:transcriptional regulator with XRE-family HTH domain
MSGRIAKLKQPPTRYEIESWVVALVKRKQPTASNALKSLRLAANCSQKELAESVKRLKGAASTWETGNHLFDAALLEPILTLLLSKLGVPLDTIKRAITISDENSHLLDIRHYKNQDADTVELEWFNSTRSQVLQTIHDLALKNNIRACELYVSLLDRCESRMAGKRTRTLRRVSPNPSFRLGDERQRLLDAQSGQVSSSQSDAKSVDSTKKTSKPEDLEVQPNEVGV